ncbi:MAG: alkaline phosphatase family protein [Bifidobacteriaceae bacterium]|nr:alkaline phosphatase family protein [Bifidobacteriaceae bacterium]
MIPPWAVRPRYGPGSLASVLPLAAARLGIELPAAERPAGTEERGPAPDGIVLVLADGLGEANLEARRGHAPYLANAPRERLTVGFPSTTAASLGSLGTGLSPGQTGLAGYSVRDPATGRRASLIKWDMPTAPEVWQPHWTLFQQLEAVGRPAVFVGEKRFKGSAMTRSSFRGARFQADGGSTRARVAAALAQARGAADAVPPPALVYVYWGELDKVGHAKGWEGPQWARALEVLDAALAELAASLPGGWELWLTADHGMVDRTGAPSWEVWDHPALAQDVALVAGEPRALHVYTDNAQAVADRWRAFLGDQAWVATKEEATAAGLFGPVDRRVEPYLGDVVVAMAGRGVILDTPHHGAGTAAMVGHHGSLTAQEMEVPFMRVRV